MMALDLFICQENISLYRKLLSDRNISDVQREIVGKMLADEEAKLLDLFSPSADAGNVIPIAPFPSARKH